jgi:biopolymer transport protein ExbB
MWIFGQIVAKTKESYEMQLLLITSIVGLALALERLYFFLKNRVKVDKSMAEIRRYVEKGDMDDLKEAARRKESPFHRVLRVLVDNFDLPEMRLMDLVEAQIIREKERMTRFLNGLSTVAAISPLLGLYGTVTGLIEAFHQIEVTGAGGPEVVGRGISIALMTTMLGLAIAVPMLIVHNFFARKAADNVSKIEVSMRELIVLGYKSGVKR